MALFNKSIPFVLFIFYDTISWLDEWMLESLNEKAMPHTHELDKMSIIMIILPRVKWETRQPSVKKQ